MTALVMGATIANRWFEQRRGLVLGILTASSATGQLVFLPLAASLIQHYGWRAAVIPVVSGCLLIALLAFALLREYPKDVGLLPYGAEPKATAPIAPPWNPSFAEPVRTLISVSRSMTFWVLFGTFFCMRIEHQRLNPNALYFFVQRLWVGGYSGCVGARHDRRF